MNKKVTRRRQQVIVQAGVVLSLLCSLSFSIVALNSNTSEIVRNFVEQNPTYTYTLLIFLSFIATAIPPVSVAIFNIIAIPYVGWEKVFVCAVIGNLIGATVGFLLAKKFKNKITDLFEIVKKIQLWQSKLTPRQEFLGLVGLRVVTYVIGDYVNYAVGVTNVRFRIFVASLIIAEVSTQFLNFYLANLGYTVNPIWFLALLVPFGLSYYAYYKLFGKKS